jgi:hypothetical protein
MAYMSCPIAVINAPVDVVWALLIEPAAWGRRVISTGHPRLFLGDRDGPARWRPARNLKYELGSDRLRDSVS